MPQQVKNLYYVFINAGNALSGVPTEKAGRLIYEFKILFTSENTLTSDNPVSTHIKQWEGKRLGFIRPNFIHDSSDNIVLRTNMTNKWRTVRYIFNYSSETFDTYVDETAIETGTSFRNLLGANYYDPIEGIFIRAHVPGGYIFYVDDVKVAYIESKPSMLNMITVNNESIENFAGSRLNYEIEIDSDVYESLSEDDIDVVLADAFSNAIVVKKVYAEVDGTKTVMVTAEDWFCRATYTIICSRRLSPDLINNFATAETSEDFNGEIYNTTLVSGSSTNVVVNDPLDASNKVMKVESNSTATAVNKSLRSLYINAKDALQDLPDEKAGRLEYEFKILFPSENTLTADYQVAVKLKQYEGMTVANLRPNNV